VAVSIHAETLLHPETATVSRERAAKPGSTRAGAAVPYTAQPRTDAGGKRWWEGRIDAVCSRKERTEKAVPHGH